MASKWDVTEYSSRRNLLSSCFEKELNFLVGLILWHQGHLKSKPKNMNKLTVP